MKIEIDSEDLKRLRKIFSIYGNVKLLVRR